MTLSRLICYDRWSPRPSEIDDTGLAPDDHAGRAKLEAEWSAARLAKLRHYALSHGLPAPDDALTFQDEGISGDDWNRPGLWSALRHVKPGTVFLVASLDRIARQSHLQAFFLDEIERLGGRLVTIENGTFDPADPASKLLAAILGAMAEFQRAVIAQRSRAAVHRKLRQGKYSGSVVPYGYRWTDQAAGEIEPIPEQQAVIDKILALAASMGGNAPYKRISAELNKAGLPWKDGGAWTWTRVRPIVDAGRPKRRKRSRISSNGNGKP